mgnify:CR=1 FL=1
MLMHKKVVQGVLVLGWLIWSLPAMGAGEHSSHEGKQMSQESVKHGDGKAGKHGGHSYGPRRGPSADISTHNNERLDPDGTKVNLNRSMIGAK